MTSEKSRQVIPLIFEKNVRWVFFNASVLIGKCALIDKNYPFFYTINLFCFTLRNKNEGKMQINFNTPIIYQDPFLLEKEKYGILRRCASFLSLNPTKHFVITEYDANKHALIGHYEGNIQTKKWVSQVCKIILYMTIILPLLSYVGSVIYRAVNRFDMEVPDSDFDLSKQTEETAQNKLKEGYYLSLKERKSLTLSEDALKKITNSMKNWPQEPLPVESKQCREGRNWAANFTITAPDFTVKWPQGMGLFTKREADDYVKLNKIADNICAKHNLFLLHIPQTISVQVDPDRYLIIQEKIKFYSQTTDQCGLYHSLAYDPDLQRYGKELLRQLTIFICKMKWADVKASNFIFNEQGKASLIDLDRDGAITGLVLGRANGIHGLFKFVPADWFDEFVELVHQNLSMLGWYKFKSEIQELKSRAEKREEKRDDILKYFANKNIESVSDPLPDSTDKNENDVMSILNQKLSAAPSDTDLIHARKITMKLQDFNKPLQEAINILTALKDKGNFHSLKFYLERGYVKILC
jgi:hypothetical protein